MEKAMMHELALSLTHMAACAAQPREDGIGPASGMRLPSAEVRKDLGTSDSVLEASRTICASFNFGWK